MTDINPEWGEPDPQGPVLDDTLCAEHRDGKPGETHEWRRGRRHHTRLVICHPTTPTKESDL